MLARVIRASLRHRRARVRVGTAAVLLGATLVSALLNLSFGVGKQAGRELRAYGANVLVMPREGALDPGGLGEQEGIAESGLRALDGMDGVVGYVPSLYIVARVGEQTVAIAGMDLERMRRIGTWLHVDGAWPSGEAGALVGARAARALGLATGQRFPAGFRGASRDLAVSGILSSGGAEDDQVLVPLATAQALAGRPGQVGLVQVSAEARSAAAVARAIEARLPGVRARTLSQFAEAEESVLAKVRLLVAIVAAMVMVVATLAVGATMVTAVLERRKEIGLLLALGAGERQVGAIFLAEGASMGALGGTAGYAAGLGIAVLIGRRVFHASVAPNPLGLPITLAAALGVVLVASLWPARRALAIDPATTLRGE